MDLERRLSKLEQVEGGSGLCPHGFRVIWPPEDGREPSGPETCPDCGLPKVVIRVVREDRDY